MNVLNNWWRSAVNLWTAHEDAFVFGGAAALVVLIAIAVYRFLTTTNRSKVVSTAAAIVAMAWTSEGLLAVAIREFHIPLVFAGMTFFVFEAMMLAAALHAEECRSTKGVPGPAGSYVFVLGACSGIVASFGAHNVGEVVLRTILPTLAVGLWWIFLVAERTTDTPEMKAEQQRVADESTWTITPRSLLVRFNIMKPGKVSVTQAQRDLTTRRMVDAYLTLRADGWFANRAGKRFDRLAKQADDDLLAAVQAQVARAVGARQFVAPPMDIEADTAADIRRDHVADIQEDTTSDTGSDMSPDTAADVTPDMSTDTGRTSRRTRNERPGGPKGGPDTRTRVAKLVAKTPDIDAATIATKLNVSERHVRRILPLVRDAVPAKPINGHDHLKEASSA